jgi:hypothetical protein
MKDRKAAHGRGKPDVSSQETGECRSAREGLHVTDYFVAVKSYTSVHSCRDCSERDGTVGNIRLICCGLMSPVTS